MELISTPDAGVAKSYGNAIIQGRVSGNFSRFKNNTEMLDDPRLKKQIEKILKDEGTNYSDADCFDIAVEVIGGSPHIVNDVFKNYDGVYLDDVGYLIVFNSNRIKNISLVKNNNQSYVIARENKNGSLLFNFVPVNIEKRNYLDNQRQGFLLYRKKDGQ